MRDRRTATLTVEQAAHSRRFMWSMTGVILLFAIGIAVTAFFLLRGGPSQPSNSSHNDQQRTGTSTTPAQSGISDLSVQTTPVGQSSAQAAPSSQAVLQQSVSVGGAASNGGSSASSAAAVQNAASATPTQVNTDNIGTIQVPPVVKPPVVTPPINPCNVHPIPPKGGGIILYPDVCRL